MKRRKFLFSGGLATLGFSASASLRTNMEQGSNGKRNNPILIQTKVLVIGGGPAGIGAAIGAAKAGAETLLIENYGFFGGVASWGLRPVSTSRHFYINHGGTKEIGNFDITYPFQFSEA